MDYTRPPPPQGAPPPYAFVNRMYRRSLRPIVLALASLSAIWLLFWAIRYFRAMSIDNTPSKLETLALVLGVMYIVVSAIEFFGVAAAITQRILLIRIYAWATFLSALTIIAAGLIRTVVHFKYKNDLINECTSLATGQEVIYRIGWGPTTSDILDADQAQNWCRRAWNRESWSEIISLIIVMFLGVFYTSIVFAYLRQSLDPTSPANAERRVRATGPGPAPGHYQPSFVPELPYGAPPPALPDHKPPSYHGHDAPEGYGLGYDAGKADPEKGDPFSDFDGPSRNGPTGIR